MNYVLAGYGITIATLGAYSLRVVLRGRALRRSLGPRVGAGNLAQSVVGNEARR
jgi:hypothetical protein